MLFHMLYLARCTFGTRNKLYKIHLMRWFETLGHFYFFLLEGTPYKILQTLKKLVHRVYDTYCPSEIPQKTLTLLC